MTKTVLGWICLIFFGLVAVDYLGNNLAGGLFSYGGTAARAQQSASQVQLGSIDFSFFGKGQKGRSYITQGYGKTAFSYVYKNGWHNGIDIAASYGAAIHSPGEGVVLATGNQDNYCPGRGFGR